MPEPRLEEVFKLSGIPTHTFVKPVEYTKLLVSLRTPGRGVVIEGPSGIGKTTAVTQALSELGLEAKTLRLSARKPEDRQYISALPALSDAGTVIVDDFHRLDEATRRSIADFLKTLADEERQDVKLIVVGINKAGDSLVAFARDLNNRIDTVRFEANPEERVRELVNKGESALNIALGPVDEIVAAANGSFYLAQMLCHETCLAADLTEATAVPSEVKVSFETVRERVMERLARAFQETAAHFAAGPKLRRAGRAPYLHILKWLAEANEWSIWLDREMAAHPEQRGSVGQVVEKGYLESYLQKQPEFAEVLHYEPSTHVLTVEDPQFVFYLRNISWTQFAEQVGYVNTTFESRYDFALSFAGPDRTVAERLFQLLADEEFEVFYDKNEQHRILAENVEEYLAPIYRSEASLVICLLGPEYPKRVWTKFESEQFHERFGRGGVIPIWFKTSPPGIFDESRRVGGLEFDPGGDVEAQLQGFVETLRKMRAELPTRKAHH